MARARDKRPPPPPPPGRLLPLLLTVIVVAMVAAFIFQVVTGALDKYLLAALVVLALAFAGYGGDRLLERITERFR